MENSMKALLIAAAVLIAIILISLGILLLSSSNGNIDKAESVGNSISNAGTTTIGEIKSDLHEGNAKELYKEGKLKIGDVVNYTPDTSQSSYEIKKEYSGYSENQKIEQKKLKWQVFSINTDGTVELVSKTYKTSFYLCRCKWI